MKTALWEWCRDPDLNGDCNQESRLHRRDNLMRYLFVSAFGLAYGWSPKTANLPFATDPRA
jgi:hypothetical protein